MGFNSGFKGLKNKGRESDQTAPSVVINKIDTSLATRHKERFDLRTRFRSNKHVLALSIFSTKIMGISESHLIY